MPGLVYLIPLLKESLLQIFLLSFKLKYNANNAHTQLQSKLCSEQR